MKIRSLCAHLDIVVDFAKNHELRINIITLSPKVYHTRTNLLVDVLPLRQCFVDGHEHLPDIRQVALPKEGHSVPFVARGLKVQPCAPCVLEHVCLQAAACGMVVEAIVGVVEKVGVVHALVELILLFVLGMWVENALQIVKSILPLGWKRAPALQD